MKDIIDNKDESEKNEDKQTEKRGNLIDPKVKEELKENFPENPLLTEYGATGGSSEKEQIAEGWIGETEDWRVKTNITPEQIIAMTQVRLLPQIFTEIEDLEEILLSATKNIEKYAVSNKGLSREQHVRVLQAMLSGEIVGESDGMGAMLKAFAGVDGEDNDD